MPENRTAVNVIVWSDHVPHKTDMFFLVTTHGNIREIKSHRDVTPAQFQEAFSFSLFRGCAVTIETLTPDFTVSQRVDLNK